MGFRDDELDRVLAERRKVWKAKELLEKAKALEKRDGKTRTPMTSKDVKDISDYLDNNTYVNQEGKKVKLIVNSYTGVKPEDYKSLNPWLKETFNLTAQAQILSANPQLAKYLEAKAKGDTFPKYEWKPTGKQLGHFGTKR